MGLQSPPRPMLCPRRLAKWVLINSNKASQSQEETASQGMVTDGTKGTYMSAKALSLRRRGKTTSPWTKTHLEPALAWNVDAILQFMPESSQANVGAVWRSLRSCFSTDEGKSGLEGHSAFAA